MTQQLVLATVVALLELEEGCHLHAYPDPLSPLGRALGHQGIVRCGNTGFIPRTHAHLSGHPWTIGFGTTGVGIEQGAVWTLEQCRAALLDRAQLAYRQALSTYPGVEALHLNAQAALTSLIYNRGASLRAIDSRREMRELVGLVRAQDYAGMARVVRSMKRLWPGSPGLLKRREREAQLIERMPEAPNPAGVPGKTIQT